MYFVLLVFFKVMAYQLDGLGESSICYFRGGGVFDANGMAAW